LKAEAGNKKKKHRVRKIILWTIGVLLVIIIGSSVFLYYNLNRILTNALNKSFNSNIASDVYELKFEKLSVNFLAGDVKVWKKLQPGKTRKTILISTVHLLRPKNDPEKCVFNR
jgi:hypothetical protein